MKFDLHIHTRRHSPDAVTDPFELVKRAQEVGLDGIVITEHDWLWTPDELDELRAAAPELVILAGIEVTGRSGDVLCYGVTNPFTLPRGLDWPSLCQEVHRQGGVCVAAHPNRWNQPFEKILTEQKPKLDGIEVMSHNMDSDLQTKAAALLQKFPHLAQLGSSDAHSPETVGCYCTHFDAVIRTNAELVAAIRGKKGQAMINDTYQTAGAARRQTV